MKLVIFGSGGHFRSVIDCLNMSLFEEIVIVDIDEKKHNSFFFGIKTVGGIEKIDDLKKLGFNHAFICIGDQKARNKYARICEEKNLELITIVDRTCSMASTVKVGKGVFIGKKTVINSNSNILDLVIVNSGAIIEHDCIIKRNSFIGPGAIITGGVIIEENTFIGSGAIINPYLKIMKNSIIGSGSVVTKDIKENLVAFGNPCKVVRENE